MNNEPVAWNEEEFNHIAYSYRSWLASDPKGVADRYDELVNYVQSITHPAKTLTDEEILIEAKYQPNLGYYLACEYDVLDFARAILRKAHE
jgi:hypothetical protein